MSTMIDDAKRIWPGIDDNEAEMLLWETTSYPFGTDIAVLKQLEQSYKKHNGNVDAAIADAYAVIDQAMCEYNEHHRMD